jgi:hypothetical protein
MIYSDFSRRQLLGTGLSLGVTGVATQVIGAPAPAVSAGASLPASAFGSPTASTVRALLSDPNLSPQRRAMLTADTRPKGLSLGSLSGDFYSVQGGLATPLHGAVMASFSRSYPQPDGTIVTKTIELEWFTNLDGTVFEEWKNPVTNKMVPHPPRKYWVHTYETDRDGIKKSVTLNTRFHQAVTGWREEGDDLWMFGEIITMPEGGGTAPESTELSDRHARISELLAPGGKPVRSEYSSRVVTGWRPWQQMGNIPGQLLLICGGHSLNGLDELPPEWVKATQKRFPELLPSLDTLLSA